ncbi:MAG: translation initiation factor IF-3 [Candidatus Paceibacterota bacterium]
MEEIRLIDENGKLIGILPLEKAQEIARQKNLDLIAVSQKAKPPVYKLGVWEKERYFSEKKLRKKLKTEKKNILKNLRIGFNEGENDLNVKIKKVENFLEKGRRVKIEIFLRGREKAHFELAEEKIKNFLTKVKKSYKIIQPLKKTPNGFFIILGS